MCSQRVRMTLQDKVKIFGVTVFQLRQVEYQQKQYNFERKYVLKINVKNIY